MNWSIGTGIYVFGIITGSLLVSVTDAGLWTLNAWAKARGGTWHQHPFLCPGCSKRHHVGRQGPAGTSCIHCAPEPRQSGGAR